MYRLEDFFFISTFLFVFSGTDCCSVSWFRDATHPQQVHHFLHHHSFTRSTYNLPPQISTRWLPVANCCDCVPGRSLSSCLCAHLPVFRRNGRHRRLYHVCYLSIRCHGSNANVSGYPLRIHLRRLCVLDFASCDETDTHPLRLAVL